MCRSAEGREETQSRQTVYFTIHLPIENDLISLMHVARQLK